MGSSYSTSETFDYQIDCNHHCSITQVVMKGAAFCGGDTTLQLWDSARTTLLAQVDTNINSGSGYYTFTLTANTDYIQSFRVVETGDTCSTWRCRNSLSITAVAGDPSLYFQGWDITGTLGECEGDCDADSECDSGLYCYHTDGLPDPILPGCSGTVATNVDYCIDSTYHPSKGPTSEPTGNPTVEPTTEPTSEPTSEPTAEPTSEPTIEPSSGPTMDPTSNPTSDLTSEPTIPLTLPLSPTTAKPTAEPSDFPSADPSNSLSNEPSAPPTPEPTTPWPTMRELVEQSATMYLNADFSDLQSYADDNDLSNEAVAQMIVESAINLDGDPSLSNVEITIIEVREGSVIIEYTLESAVDGAVALALNNIEDTVGESITISDDFVLVLDSNTLVVPTTEPFIIPTSKPTPIPTLLPDPSEELTISQNFQISDSPLIVVVAVLIGVICCLVGCLMSILVMLLYRSKNSKSTAAEVTTLQIHAQQPQSDTDLKMEKPISSNIQSHHSNSNPLEQTADLQELDDIIILLFKILVIYFVC